MRTALFTVFTLMLLAGCIGPLAGLLGGGITEAAGMVPKSADSFIYISPNDDLIDFMDGGGSTGDLEDIMNDVEWMAVFSDSDGSASIIKMKGNDAEDILQKMDGSFDEFDELDEETYNGIAVYTSTGYFKRAYAVINDRYVLFGSEDGVEMAIDAWRGDRSNAVEMISEAMSIVPGGDMYMYSDSSYSGERILSIQPKGNEKFDIYAAREITKDSEADEMIDDAEDTLERDDIENFSIEEKNDYVVVSIRGIEEGDLSGSPNYLV